LIQVWAKEALPIAVGIMSVRLLSSAFVCCLVAHPLFALGPTATTVRATGIIEAYDAAAHLVSLATSAGVTRFTLGSAVRVRRKHRALDPSELSRAIGCRASVRYLDEPAGRVVESVHVADCPHRGRTDGD
jgi:hypothetical protein